jgi:hypothetical protein
MPRRRRVWVIISAAVFLAAAGVLAAGLLSGGCTERPKAPSLTNDAVYQNDTIGLRFLVPEGWPIASRTELPPGGLPKPLILASYILSQADHPARLEVLAAEVPEGTDLYRFLADNPVGPQKWRALGPPQTMTINGAPATRHSMASGSSRAEVRREATAFHRGDRVFIFLVTFGASDSAARDTARRSIESVTWGK